MQFQIRPSICVIATAVMIASCASKGPVSSTDMAATGVSAQGETSSEYQSLVENASQQLVCRREAVTGSRIPSQVCFTPAQLKEQREQSLEMVREMQQRAAMTRSNGDRPPSPPPSPPRSGP